MVGEAQVEYINHLAYLLGHVLEKLPGDIVVEIRDLLANYDIKVKLKLPNSNT